MNLRSFPVRVRSFSFFLSVLVFSGTLFSQETVFKEHTIYIPYEKLRKTFESEGRGVFLPYEQFRALSDAAEKAAKTLETPLKPPVATMIADSVNELIVRGDIAEVTATLRIVLLEDGWHQVPLRLQDAAIREATIDGEPARILGDPQQGYRLLIEKPQTKPEKVAAAEGSIDRSGVDKDRVGERNGAEGNTAENSKTDGDSANRVANQAAKTVELRLVYAKQIDKTPGRNDVSLSVPPAPMSRWKVIVPEPGVKIDFAPLVAASEEASDGKDFADHSADRTVVHAYVGAAPVVRIGWTPKSEGGTGLEALLNAQMDQQVHVDEGVLRTTAKIDYTISRSQVEKLAIRVPADQKVVGLFDANIRQWTLSQGDGSQTIDIALFEPAKDKQSIQLELERIFKQETPDDPTATDAAGERLAVPSIVPLGIGRLQGVLVVRAGDGLTLDTMQSAGLMQMDPGELSGALRDAAPGGRWDFIYRLSTTRYALELELRKIRPEIVADSQIEVFLYDTDNPVGMRFDSVYTIEKAGVFQFQIDVPRDFRITTAIGVRLNGSTPAEIDTWFENKQADPADGVVGGSVVANNAVPGEKPSPAGESKAMRRWTVKLKRKAIGRVGLTVHLAPDYNGPYIRKALGQKESLAIPLPGVAPSSVQRFRGKLIVNSPDVFRLSPTATRGMQPVSVELIKSEIQNNKWWGAISPQWRLAYVFEEEPTSLTLDIERRKPQLTVKLVQTLRIEDTVIRNRIDLNYDVKFTDIPELRVDVPESISDRIEKIDGYRESVLSPQPEDVPEGYVALAYHKDSLFFGTGKLTLAWSDGLKSLEIGKSEPVVVPRIFVPKREPHDRIWGQILLAKAPSIDLSESPATRGLRPIDPQHDIAAADRIPDATTAFEYQGDWFLKILATRYKLEDVKRTSIECGLVQAVFTKNNDTISSRALYRIRGVQQRLDLLMPAGAVFDDVTINGSRITLESAGESVDQSGSVRYLIPLTSVSPDTPFTLELRYTQPRRGGTVAIPDFPGEIVPDERISDQIASAETTNGPVQKPAVQLMYLAVYLPEEDVITAYGGPWSRHYRLLNRPDEPYLETYNGIDIRNIVHEIGSGTVRDFPVGGNAYLFSTLQPDGTADGLLAIRTARSTPVVAGILVFVMVIGVLLMRTSLYRRLQAVCILIAALVLAWVFCPTFLELGTTFSAGKLAILCVAALWFLQGLNFLRRKINWRNMGRFFLQPLFQRSKPEPEKVPADQACSENTDAVKGGADHE